VRNDGGVGKKRDKETTIIGQLPKHRPRRRSPLRESPASESDQRGPTPDPFTAKPVDLGTAAAAAGAVRAAAEVADLALTATAVLLREIVANLDAASNQRRR
jgi:hypothetical protein